MEDTIIMEPSVTEGQSSYYASAIRAGPRMPEVFGSERGPYDGLRGFGGFGDVQLPSDWQYRGGVSVAAALGVLAVIVVVYYATKK